MEGKKLIRKIWKKYPKKLQEVWDRCGLQIGKIPSEVKKIMVCLDYDTEMCMRAKELKPDLIISHHPFIFGTRMAILNSDENKMEVAKVTEEELHSCVYSFHTCFDNANPGMNDTLAKKLGLEEVYTPQACLTMRIGTLPNEMTVDEFKDYALEKLNVSYGLLVQGNNRPIHKVGIIGGGASRDYTVAIDEGCDIYISGDMAHHTRREIIERRFNYLDVPHEVERVFMEHVKRDLNEIDPEIEVFTFDHEREAKVVCRKTKF